MKRGCRMGETIKFNSPYWKGFRLPDEKQRWLYTDEDSAIRLYNKDYFNKNTTSVIIYIGYETEENDVEPISDIIYLIGIDYNIANYFGDKSGRHHRSKRYVVIGGKVYQQVQFGKVKEVKRITRELRGVLEEIR